MPKAKMNIAASTTGTAMMMKSMHEGDHPARQHALEQFRVRRRIVGVRFDVDRHGAFAPWIAGRSLCISIEMAKKSAARKGASCRPTGWNAGRPCGMVRASPGDLA